MSDSSHRDVAVFTEALQLPADKRAAYLDLACRGDLELRQQVEALLAGHKEAGDFLEHSPREAVIESRSLASTSEKAGDRIGRYKLLQQIGEGGCGIVFMAEQEEPVRRRVALKIIKPGMDTRSVIARFEAERQALALMDHPSIAKMLDAGATNSGRPYFVMELVRGLKITEYCDKHSLTTAERLKLFVQVCLAVQHAHQKGIIHRDIKPSNILVTTTLEGVALPVVIDFGIAKATTNQRLTDKTLFTAFEMLIGTPAYMSPEQAELTSVDVDTRTDIYSLGVLLYELLTSSTPFDTTQLLKSGLDEVRRVIREQEPVRPSTWLSRMTGADLTIVADRRKSDPPVLIRSVSGDLDWIAMKALEKDRTRRYETAYGLALDVQRYLANEPVSARPPSQLYKLQKTVLRNQLVFLGIGIIVVLLAAGLVVVSATLAKERRSRREAEAAESSARAAEMKAETAERKAEASSVKSQQVTQFLVDMLDGVGPAAARGQDTQMLRSILDRTAERIGTELTNQPEVEVELSSLLGGLYEQIGIFDQAERMHREALAIDQKLFGPESKETAASLNNLGLALVAQEHFPEAEKADAEALAIRRRLFGDDNPDTATSLNDLGAVYRQEGKLSEAEGMVRKALGVREQFFPHESLEVADSLRNLCIILGDERKWAESETLARDVLAIRRKLLGPDHPWVASSLDDLAWAAGGNGQDSEVEGWELEALAIRQKVLPEKHRDLAKSLHLIGDTMREQGKPDEAYGVLSAALSIQSDLLGQDDPALVGTMHSLGMTLRDQGKLAEAEKVFREALVMRRKHGGDEDPQTLTEVASLAGTLAAEKKYDDAEQLLDGALTPAVLKLGVSADLLNQRVDLNARLGRWQAAAADEALAVEREPMHDPLFPVLAALLVKTGNHSAYEQFRHRLLATFTNTDNLYQADQVAKACLFLPPADADLPALSHLTDLPVMLGTEDKNAMPYFQDNKALCEYRQRHFAEAIEWAQKPLEIPGIYVHGHSYAILAMANWQLGKKDEARVMLAKGAALDPQIMPARIAEDPSNAWVAWLFARIQLDEATSLIQPGLTNETTPAGQ
jgi:serine/threonine protein kinase/Tfp pilus assembly protein PilF